MLFHHHHEDDGGDEHRSELGLGAGSSSKPTSSCDDLEAVERASIQDERHESHEIHEKSPPPRASLELKRTASRASNVLERVFTTRSITDPGPPPDGGFKAWLMVACAWVTIFTTWGWVNSYGAFQTYYTHTLGVSPSTASWIGTVQNFLTFFIGAFSGRLLDAGYFVPTFLVGVILQLLGIFMMSLSTKYWQLMLTQGVLTGLGGGIFFTPSMGLLATYFSKRRAFAIGIASTGNSVGGIVYPLIVKELVPRVGFAWTARVLGFVNLIFLSFAFAFLRPRLPPRTSGPIIDWKAFKDPTYSFFVAGMFFIMWAVYYTFYYISSYAVDVTHLNINSSTTFVIVLNAVGIPARVIPPYFTDRVGQLNMGVPTMFCLAAIAFSWLGVSNISGLYIFTVFYGLFAAAFQCLIPSTVASITPDLSMVGTRLGMAFSIASLAALTGPPIGGAIQGAMGGSYQGASAWAAISTLLSAIFIGAARIAKAGWKFDAKC